MPEEGKEDMSKEEQPTGERFDIGPPKEHYEKFRIGDTEEELKKARGPAWQHEMPDIRMQDEGERDRIEEELRRREDPFFRLNRNFRRLARGLETLNYLEELKKIPEKDLTKEQIKLKENAPKVREETEKNLPILYDRLMIHNLLDVQLELDVEYLRLRNPVPFETRQEDYYFRDLQRGILTALLEEDWSRPEKARLWLLKMYRDVLSTASHRDLLKGMAGGLDKFFDWKLILDQVKERYKEDPTSDSYELTFKRKFRGEDLPKAIDEKEAFLMRERSVRYHSDYRYWSMAVASVHQMDYDSEGDRVISMENLSETEIEFMQKLFGTSEKGRWEDYHEDETKWASYKGRDGKSRRFPHRMLNWPSMASTQAKKEIYIATMSELLRWTKKDKGGKEERDENGKVITIREELGNPESEYQNRKKLEELVEEIKKSVRQRRKIWYSPGIYGTSLDQIQEEPGVALDLLQADTIVKSGIVYDWGHKAGVHLGWGYKYDYDKEEGEFKRKTDNGGTTVATDISTGAWWREFKRINYGVKGWPTSPLPDMDGEYMKMLADRPPDYRPTLEDMSDNAAITQKDIKDKKSFHYSLGRLQRSLKEANPELWDMYLKDMVWYWETPYKNKHERNLVLPIFAPPVFESVNYWHAIPWDPEKKITDEVEYENGKNGKMVIKEPGAPTAWEELQGGADLAEKKWSEGEESQLDDQAYYKHLITMGQINKLLQVMNEKPENIDRQFIAFFEASTLLDEFRKRGDLGVRNERLPIAIINMSLIPLMIVVATAKKRGIFPGSGMVSEDAASKSTLGEWVASDLEEWRRVIMHSTPEEREGIKGYRDAMVAFFDFYATQIVLAANQEALVLEGEEREQTKYLVDIIAADTGVEVEYFPPEDMPEQRVRR